MRTDLDDLPVERRRELARVATILFDEFEAAMAGKNAPHRKAGRILKIVLFGSYARGDWVVDPVGGYYSDFDILVVVNHDELADADHWHGAEAHILRDLEAGTLQTQVNLIVHSLADVNERLRRGRAFFADIVRDGVLLHDTQTHSFDVISTLSREAARQEAQKYFDEWFPDAAYGLQRARNSIGDGQFNFAAFDLHQATERLYHCTLLVLTLYSPKSHKLNFLRGQAERIAPTLIRAWPRDTRFAQRCFELLRRAYVDARYSPHYRITITELDWLLDHVGELQALVEAACNDHLRDMGDA